MTPTDYLALAREACPCNCDGVARGPTGHWPLCRVPAVTAAIERAVREATHAKYTDIKRLEAAAIDAYSQESGALWRDQIEREKRAAVVAVLREAIHLQEIDEDIGELADDLDRLAGRPVGTLLKEVRGE